MTNVLPQQAGLEVSNVIYQYNTVKNVEDYMIVSVQNENALGDGYIFREIDDWSGLPGNKISKVVPAGNIPIQYWGNGEIAVEGLGTVENARVVYTYQFDPCFDPQSDPSCPGYIAPFTFTPDTYQDPLDDSLIQDELNKKYDSKKDKEEEQRRRFEQMQEKKERLQLALGAVNSALFTANAVAQEAMLFAMNQKIETYYTTIPGGTYKESAQYTSEQMPDNASARRVNLAQQVLHQQMVDAQYK